MTHLDQPETRLENAQLRVSLLRLLLAIETHAASDEDILVQLNEFRSIDTVSDLKLLIIITERTGLSPAVYCGLIRTLQCIGEKNLDCKKMVCHVLREIALFANATIVRSEALESRLELIAGESYDPMGGAHIPPQPESSFTYRHIWNGNGAGGIIADLVGPRSPSRLKILAILDRT